ncbi:SMYD3 [Symbiodinium natans]|uniref:SMYD3 protein n=1 Tax=Symbiodinium natans TaxID=878477 RepID=A0A812PCR2_9DINO|nr:SMYD3 [Symbiodinium natans]
MTDLLLERLQSGPPAAYVATFGALFVLILALGRQLALLRQAAEKFEIVGTRDRGKAVVARTRIEKGGVVLVERALLSVPAGVSPIPAVGMLGRRARSLLESLYCPASLSASRSEDGSHALSDEIGQHGEQLRQRMVECGVWSARKAEVDFSWAWTVLRVWDANKLSFMSRRGHEQCIFHKISRFNHSCEPNVRLLPTGEPGELMALATVAVEPGKELCICYPERNVLPMLHFLHLPTSWRRHVLQRWQFHCCCARCKVPADATRCFRCPTAECPGSLAVRADGLEVSTLAPCGACGLVLQEEEMRQLLAKEQAAEQESHDLSRKLKSTKGTEDFPLESVMELLGKCWEAGFSVDHWMCFWLLSLAAVGSSERPLNVASYGVARSTTMPALPGTFRALAETAPASAGSLLLAADRRNLLQRPGASTRLCLYLTFQP